MTLTRRMFIAAAFAAPSVAWAASGADAKTAPYFNTDGIAINETDPGGYFTQGRPVAGNAAYSLGWQGAYWHFESLESRAAFEIDPHAYAPQYGGYCALAVASGDLAPSAPHAWKIVDGKLYLIYSPFYRRQWEQDLVANIAAADEKWPTALGT